MKLAAFPPRNAADCAASTDAVRNLQPNRSIADVDRPVAKRVAFFLSCDSFETFFGGMFGLDRETYLASYRNDFVWEYAQGLAMLGHPTWIYILSYGRPELRRVDAQVQVRFLPMPRWRRAVDAVLYRFGGRKGASWLRARAAYAGYRGALRDALRRDGIDVLYHQEIWTTRFDVVVQDLPVPVIGADHGGVYADWMAEAKKTSFPKAAWVLCQSAIGLQRALEFGGRAKMACNGVDTDFFIPPDPASEKRGLTVLSVGRLADGQKRFSDLLRAMQRLPEYQLTVVGSGPDEAMLKDLAVQLGVADRVRWAGFVSDRGELRRLYQTCGVFVSTSAWEAVALVLLEAMSCGAPVVATRIPSFEDLLTDGVDGLLVPVGAPEDVAKAVRRAHECQVELASGARQTVCTRYSAAALYRTVSELIEGV
jgi:glycosyltransferase involved in cell wall biosynthesis